MVSADISIARDIVVLGLVQKNRQGVRQAHYLVGFQGVDEWVS